MAVKLRLGEKEILEKAVRSAAASREHYQRQMEKAAPLPKYEEGSLGLLEAGGTDSRLPLGLRNLEGEALTLAVSRAQATEQRLTNGDATMPNGTRPGLEDLAHEASPRVADSVSKDSSSDGAGGLQA